MDTETLDKLYLEISQFTEAKTNREIKLATALDDLMGDVRDFISDENNGLGPNPDRLRIALRQAEKVRT